MTQPQKGSVDYTMKQATTTESKDTSSEDERMLKPLMVELKDPDVSEAPEPMEPPPGDSIFDRIALMYFPGNPDFFASAMKLLFCFCGLQVSYLTWGFMQELTMTKEFNPTNLAPDGKFPSAAFCVFSNRFLAVIVAIIAVKIRHGAVFANNKAPLMAFFPCALTNTTSSWSQYASLKYVSFPVQTVFKSSKIIPVMLMGILIKGTKYPLMQYLEALLITLGVAVFSVASKTSDSTTETQLRGLLLLLCYIGSDSFTSQWQSRVYETYGKNNVDPYQMMLGVNVNAIVITSTGLFLTGDFLMVYEFLLVNPTALYYNIVTAITSASGQVFIFYTIKEFGPIVFTIIMTTRQLISICISSLVFGHHISLKAVCGAIVVFGVLFCQIRRKYITSGIRSAPLPETPSSSAEEKDKETV